MDSPAAQDPDMEPEYDFRAMPGVVRGKYVALTDAQRQELARRSAEYRQNPTAGSTWAEVKARLLGGD